MKKLIIAALVVMFAATAHATPYLVCDPQDGVTEYEIVDNGNPVFSLRYDLADIAKGEHSYSVKACNMWGCSESSGIVIIKTVPVAPVLKIEIEK